MTNEELHNPACMTDYLGLWAIEPSRFQMLFGGIKSGLVEAQSTKTRKERVEATPYQLTSSGVAIVPLVGAMMKGVSKYGGASTVLARQALRHASRNEKVESVLMVIDSPGGTVSGTETLAEEVKRTKAIKPVHAHIDDLGASAAYWVAANASSITVNATGIVGSVGTIAVVVDESKSFEMEGLRTHVVATGARKGDFVPGTPVDEDALSALRDLVEKTNEHFLRAVKAGRGVSSATMEKVSDASIFIASDAFALGLVDGIMTIDDRMAAIETDIEARRQAKNAANLSRRARAGLSIESSKFV